MGTNFYWIDLDTLMVPQKNQIQGHLGKRSAAGYYCWDCEAPLVIGGKRELVHTSSDMCIDICPKCGQGKSHETLDTSSAGVELGFAQPRTERPHGVRSCSSFSWAQEPAYIVEICRQRKNEPIINDEYGRVLTGQEFVDMLDKNCPIQFTNSIGHNFT